MPNIFTIGLVTAALAVPVTAIAQTGEGRDLARLAFKSVDQDERGFIDQGEYTNFAGDVFVSMDYDENSKLSLDEFLSWGFGLEQVAEKAGRADAFETAMRVVFAFWDRDGDTQITKTEFRQSIAADFRRADFNNDAVLSEEEFLSGFSINIAARAAINPPPAK